MSGQAEILVIDDTPITRNLLTDILSAKGFQVRSANNGELALDLIAATPPHLILLDIMMPEMDGFEVCRRLKSKEESKKIPILFISGLTNPEEKVKGFGLGAVDFISKPFQREELLARVRTHLELSQLQTKLEARILERTNQLYALAEQLKQNSEKLNKTMGGIIQAIALTVGTRDPYTASHQGRVADIAQAIAQEMGLSDEQVDGLRMAGLVHDLGKISVPAEILSKPTRLSELEFSLIKSHSEAGYEILREIDFPWPIAKIVLQHHERLDGSGYPHGLKAGQILEESKILAVADVVEAMASHRPYRPALGIEKALEEISQNRDVLYDPGVVDACLRLFREEGMCLSKSEIISPRQSEKEGKRCLPNLDK